MLHISQHRRANMAGFTLQLLVFFGLVCLSYQQSSHARYALQASDDYVDLDDIETIRANGRMDFGVTGAVVAEIIKNLKDAIKIEEIFDTSLNLFKKIPIIGIIANRIEFMLKTCKCFKTAINHFLDTQKNYARYGLQESNDYVSEDGLKMLAKDDETGSPIAKLLGSYLEGSQLVLNVTDQLGEGIIGLIKVLINNTNDLPKTLGKIFHIEVLVKKVFNPQLQDLTKKVLQQFKDLPILVQIFDRLNKILGRQSKDKVDKHSA